MSSEPWKDCNWSPGVLSDSQVKKLGKEGFIEYLSESDDDIDGSSFDLHLTDVGYKLKHGTIKPCGDRYHNILKNDNLVETLQKDDLGIFTPLEPGNSYVFKIKERLHFREEHNIYMVKRQQGVQWEE